MKNIVNMLRFSLKQSDLALLGNFKMTILISLLAFYSFKISVNEYIPSVAPLKLKRESSLDSLLIYTN